MTERSEQARSRELALQELNPNPWFRSCLEGMEPGKLFIAKGGEGRSAVHAARLGWEVDAYDRSSNQQRKALELAESEGVGVHYELGAIEDLQLEKGRYDAIAVLYVHLPPIARKRLHSQLVSALRQEGQLILEAFAKEQIAYNSGGPPDIDRLYSLEDIEKDFSDLELLSTRNEETDVMEGERVLGPGRVVRVLGRKGKE